MDATRTLAVGLIVMLLLAGCSSSTTTSSTSPSSTTTKATTSTTTSRAPGLVTINQTGSSTLLPVAEAWANEFEGDLKANVTVRGGGTAAGFAKFCQGGLEIADASRAINASEKAACKEHEVVPFEVQVALDGIAVVTPKINTFASCLTVAQLHKVWTATSKRAKMWSDLNAGWPKVDIELYGPGNASGTFDYWNKVIIVPTDGANTTSHRDYNASEDDNVIAAGVASGDYGLGYFGYSYYLNNTDKLNLIKVDEGKGLGCVAPSAETVGLGTYSPLSRPLFVYTDHKPKGILKSYLQQALSDKGQDLVVEAGAFKLPATKLIEMRAKIA